MSSALTKEWGELKKELSKMEDVHHEYMEKLSELTKVQGSCLKTIKHEHYILKNFKETLKKAEESASTSEEKEIVANICKEMTDAVAKLHSMETELPVPQNGFYLSLILGQNLNLSLLTKNDKYKYKTDYELFKWKVTLAIIFLTILSYLFPWRVMDSIGNFLLVWYYCTLTIRETILRINGSRIKGWWVAHHYLSCVLCSIVLTWKDGECYQSFRHQFLLFTFYIAFLQLLQSQYQAGCLRRLHALGQGHQMDITVEGFKSFMFKGLTFLLPFLLAGYIFQLYNAYTLWYLSYDCEGQWQVFALCCMFFILAVGNITTTSMVILKKLRTSSSYNFIVGLTTKYRPE
ncbi:Transmembrane protein [Trichostrongylus colubriformis]|uniref:Transmembrane protein n=1 Tax=Trichostrongylus colubriformis TaxID=6319 RepID=A0AAN8G1H8_TRICO